MNWLDGLLYGVRRVLYAGAEMPERTDVNFTGAGVVVTDNAGAGRTDVTIAGAGPGAGLALTAVKTAAYTAAIGELVLVDATAGDITIDAPAATAHTDERWGLLRVEPTLPVSNVVTIAAADGVNDEATRDLPIAHQCIILRSDGSTWRVESEFLDVTVSDATPQGVGTMGNAGTSHGIAREDHVHALGFTAVQSALSGASSPVGFGSQRITGLADGMAASDAATVGQLGGGATIVAPSASALLWVLNETSSPFAQTGKAVSLDMTLTGASELSFAAPLGDGVWLPSGAVALATADTAEGEATNFTWHWWGHGAAASADYCGPSKIAVTGAAFAIALQVDAGGADAVLFHRHSGSTSSTAVTCPRLKRALMENSWHHYSMSFDGSVDKKFRVYVDGTLVWTSSAEAAVVDWGDHRGYYVTGTHGIQRITVEPTTLTLAAIREIATRGLGWVP